MIYKKSLSCCFEKQRMPILKKLIFKKCLPSYNINIKKHLKRTKVYLHSVHVLFKSTRVVRVLTGRKAGTGEQKGPFIQNEFIFLLNFVNLGEYRRNDIFVYLEYCAPAWCRSAHTRLIDSVLNDASGLPIWRFSSQIPGIWRF